MADFHTTNHSTLSLLSLFSLSFLSNSSPQWLFLCNTTRLLVINLSNGESSVSVARWLTLYR
jgi:hypothetical protein